VHNSAGTQEQPHGGPRAGGHSIRGARLRRGAAGPVAGGACAVVVGLVALAARLLVAGLLVVWTLLALVALVLLTIVLLLLLIRGLDGGRAVVGRPARNRRKSEAAVTSCRKLTLPTIVCRPWP